jgi:hypothetical protein
MGSSTHVVSVMGPSPLDQISLGKGGISLIDSADR